MGAITSNSIHEVGAARALDTVLLDPNGNIITSLTGPGPAVATESVVPVAVAEVVLLAANAARRKFLIYNNSGKTLKIKYGTGVTAVSFSNQIAAKAGYESEVGDYTGVITGIWAGNDPGDAHVTELA